MSHNYDKEMQDIMGRIPEGEKLLLHSCCGPCSSAVLERLAAHFNVTLVYYNPNIWPPEEYRRRRETQIEILKKLPVRYPVIFEELPYDPAAFLQAAEGLEAEQEGGARCEKCFCLRLKASARMAAERGFSWFTTTLSVSPHKNAAVLNAIGQKMGEKYGVNYLPADFKKRDGYKRSLTLSAEYGLYRQDYCGCQYSYEQRFGNDVLQKD